MTTPRELYVRLVDDYVLLRARLSFDYSLGPDKLARLRADMIDSLRSSLLDEYDTVASAAHDAVDRASAAR